MRSVFPYLALASLLLLASLAHAQPSSLFSMVGSAGGQILMSPGGIALALGNPGTEIRVAVRDNANLPINGLVAGDFEIEAVAPATMADGFNPGILAHDVRPAGFSQVGPGDYLIAGPLFAGGQAFNGFLVRVLGVQLPNGTPTPHFAVSPDITADGFVNLPDVGAFAAAFLGVYDPACDFNFDGVLNLADVGILASHLGETYPIGWVLDPVD